MKKEKTKTAPIGVSFPLDRDDLTAAFGSSYQRILDGLISYFRISKAVNSKNNVAGIIIEAAGGFQGIPPMIEANTSPTCTEIQKPRPAAGPAKLKTPKAAAKEQNFPEGWNTKDKTERLRWLRENRI